MRSTKLTPLTTRPSVTSRQGMIRFASTGGSKRGIIHTPSKRRIYRKGAKVAKERKVSENLFEFFLCASLRPSRLCGQLFTTPEKQNARLHEAAGRFGEIREKDWISRVSASRRGERHRNAFGICRCGLRYPQTARVR